MKTAQPLPAEWFQRHDEAPDAAFYAAPRLVTHIDAGAIAAVTDLYRASLPPGGAILDLMSSWVSHLPPEVPYRRVAGLGMNRRELEANPRLSEFVVQDLNTLPTLPYAEAEFDGAGICVSIQYLTRPAEVLRDVGRVLRVGAPLVISFSNRCFPAKAVAVWQSLDDAGHARLIERYLQAAGNWTGVESLDRSPHGATGAPLGDPLYAVVARSTGRQA
jgi:SAM-dependent methyltransferase